MRTAQKAVPARREKTEKKEKIKYFDYSLLFIIVFLVGFGLVMLYSVSAYEAQTHFHGDGLYYLKKQAEAVALGFAGMFIVSFIPYGFWKKMSIPAYVIALLLCIAVVALGVSSNGSKRWLEIGGFSFQPSELAKIAIIIFMAALLSRIPKQVAKFGTVIKILIRVAPVILLIAYSNLSTAVIVAGICVLMIFVTSPKYSHFIVLAVLCVAAGTGGIMMMSYRADRVKAWLHPELYPDDAYQTLQGLYAIGSGGLFGKGLGGSMQKLGYVPEAQNDFIFTIICEELGLFGAVCVILLFILLIWRFMVIANNAPDLFSALIVVGVMSHIILQVVLNIAVVTNTIPNTGVTLPFISYGGTSIAILLSEMGLVLGVSRKIRLGSEPPVT